MEKEYHIGVTGKITYLNEAGWGFINSHAIAFERIYFHWTGLTSNSPNFKHLEKGDGVKFTAHTNVDKKGRIKWKAINVEVTSRGRKESGSNSKGSGKNLEDSKPTSSGDTSPKE
jgi:hypothetical protein